MINYLPWAIAHLGALALMLLCSAGLGNLLLRRCRFDNLIERIVFTTALGLGLCALLLFLLGTLGLLYQSVIWVLTVAGAMATGFNVFYANRGSLRFWGAKRNLGVWETRNFFNLTHSGTGLFQVSAVC